MTTVQPEAPTASPAPTEQSISTFFHVETMVDLDDGQLQLLTATESNLGDLRISSPARALGMVEEIEARLGQVKRLIKEHEARDTLQAILAEHDVQMEEWDTESLDPKLRDKFVAFAMLTKDGRRLIVVPQGQGPVERVNAVAALVNDLQAQEATGEPA